MMSSRQSLRRRAAKQRDALAAFHVEMLRVYCRDAEVFASDAAAGLL